MTWAHRRDARGDAASLRKPGLSVKAELGCLTTFCLLSVACEEISALEDTWERTGNEFAAAGLSDFLNPDNWRFAGLSLACWPSSGS